MSNENSQASVSNTSDREAIAQWEEQVAKAAVVKQGSAEAAKKIADAVKKSLDSVSLNAQTLLRGSKEGEVTALQMEYAKLQRKEDELEKQLSSLARSSYASSLSEAPETSESASAKETRRPDENTTAIEIVEDQDHHVTESDVRDPQKVESELRAHFRQQRLLLLDMLEHQQHPHQLKLLQAQSRERREQEDAFYQQQLESATRSPQHQRQLLERQASAEDKMIEDHEDQLLQLRTNLVRMQLEEQHKQAEARSLPHTHRSHRSHSQSQSHSHSHSHSHSQSQSQSQSSPQKKKQSRGHSTTADVRGNVAIITKSEIEMLKRALEKESREKERFRAMYKQLQAQGGSHQHGNEKVENEEERRHDAALDKLAAEWQSKYENLTVELKSTRQKLSTELQQQLMSHTTHMKKAMVQISELSSALTEKDGVLEKLLLENSQLKAANDGFKTRLNGQDTAMSTWEDSMKMEQELRQKVEMKARLLEDKCKKVSEKLRNTESDVQHLQTEKQELSARIVQLEGRAVKLSNKVSKLQDEKQKMEATQADKLEKMSKGEAVLRGQIRELEGKLDSKTGTAVKLQKTHRQDEQELEAKNKLVDMLTSQLALKSEEMKTVREEMQRAKTTAETALFTVEENTVTIQRLEQDNHAREVELFEAVEENRIQKQLAKELLTELDEWKRKAQETAEQYNQATQAMVEREKEREKEMTAKSVMVSPDFVQAAAAQHAHSSRGQQSVERLSPQISALALENSALRQEVEDLQSALKDKSQSARKTVSTGGKASYTSPDTPVDPSKAQLGVQLSNSFTVSESSSDDEDHTNLVDQDQDQDQDKHGDFETATGPLQTPPLRIPPGTASLDEALYSSLQKLQMRSQNRRERLRSGGTETGTETDATSYSPQLTGRTDSGVSGEEEQEQDVSSSATTEKDLLHSAFKRRIMREGAGANAAAAKNQSATQTRKKSKTAEKEKEKEKEKSSSRVKGRRNSIATTTSSKGGFSSQSTSSAGTKKKRSISVDSERSTSRTSSFTTENPTPRIVYRKRVKETVHPQHPAPATEPNDSLRSADTSASSSKYKDTSWMVEEIARMKRSLANK